MKSVLVLGSKGQLGNELFRTRPDDIELNGVDIDELDVTDCQAVTSYIKKNPPDVLINCAAYTAVDQAEAEEEAAFSANRDAASYIARACIQFDVSLVHISTDFVFDGKKSQPYLPEDGTNPLGVYGKSKLAGEQVLLDLEDLPLTIIRTAWLYSAFGNNFVKTMLRLMQERDSLGIVADQIGTPTYARSLAEVIWRFMDAQPTDKIYHWTDSGAASWFDFAVAIQEEALALGMLKQSIDLEPITTAEYPTAAARPPYSVLDKSSSYLCLSYKGVHWRVALRHMLSELKEIGQV